MNLLKMLAAYVRIPVFQEPDVVKIASIVTAASVYLTVHHQGWLDPFAFNLAMGLGMLYLSTAVLALRTAAGNTAVYVVFLGAVMLLAGFTFTDKDSVAGLAVDGMAAQIVGLVGGMFAAVFGRMGSKQ